MPEIHAGSKVPTPIPGNRNLDFPVPFGVIAHNAQHNDRDMCLVQRNLPPFFLLALQRSLDTAWMDAQAKPVFYLIRQIYRLQGSIFAFAC